MQNCSSKIKKASYIHMYWFFTLFLSYEEKIIQVTTQIEFSGKKKKIVTSHQWNSSVNLKACAELWWNTLLTISYLKFSIIRTWWSHPNYFQICVLSLPLESKCVSVLKLCSTMIFTNLSICFCTFLFINNLLTILHKVFLCIAKCLHYLTGDVSSFSLSFLYSVLPMNHSTYFLKCHLIYYFKRRILLFLKKNGKHLLWIMCLKKRDVVAALRIVF